MWIELIFETTKIRENHAAKANILGGWLGGRHRKTTLQKRPSSVVEALLKDCPLSAGNLSR